MNDKELRCPNTVGKYWIMTYIRSRRSTLQPLYNTVRYNAVLDITRFEDGSQKCIDYIEK